MFFLDLRGEGVAIPAFHFELQILIIQPPKVAGLNR